MQGLGAQISIPLKGQIKPESIIAHRSLENVIHDYLTRSQDTFYCT